MPNLAARKEWALKLARLGFEIFPIPAFEKKPEIGGGSWLLKMSSDPDVVAGWFNDTPDMNYAVCPGAGHVVIDLDQKNGKDGVGHWAVLESLEDTDDWVSSATLRVRTPSGGVHLYLKTDASVSNGHNFGGKDCGVDIRGAHGYVVGPYSYTVADERSKTYEGEYSVENDVEIRAAPEWVMSRTNSVRERSASAPPFLTGEASRRSGASTSWRQNSLRLRSARPLMR